MARINNFIIIFAVTEKYKSIYQALTKRISGSFVDILSADGANIINIVQDKYEEITTSVRVSGSKSSKVAITFSVECGGAWQPGSKCRNISLGQVSSGQ